MIADIDQLSKLELVLLETRAQMCWGFIPYYKNTSPGLIGGGEPCNHSKQP